MKKFAIISLTIGALIALHVMTAYATPVTQPFGGGSGTGVVPLPGQVLIGTGGSVYTPAYITCVSGCTVATSSGGIAITGTGGGSGSGVPSTTPFTSGYLPVISSSLALTNSGIYQSSSGNFGIGTTNPQKLLELQGQFPALRILNTNSGQFAGSAFYLINSAGSLGGQAGNSFYSGILDGSATQGFFAIDENDSTQASTGHLMLFTGTSTAEIYPKLLVNGNNVQLSQSASGYLDIQEVAGLGNGEQSIVELVAPTTSPQEATFSIQRVASSSASNREFTDFTDENYNTSDTTALKGGIDHISAIDISKQGTGTFRPFAIRFWDQSSGGVSTSSFVAFQITPNTNGATTSPASVTGAFAGAFNASGTISQNGTPVLTSLSGALLAANNLSDLTNTSTARSNLGLTDTVLQASSTWLKAANNLSDLANTSTARTNLGIYSAAGTWTAAQTHTAAVTVSSTLSATTLNVTSTATIGGAITQTGGVNSLASTTVNGFVAATTVTATTSITVAGAAVSTSTGANPTASIGIAAVNGSANTFMRSDGAPKLSQQYASTTIPATNYDATTTGEYAYFVFTAADFSFTISNFGCQNVAATTSYQLIRTTSSINKAGQDVTSSTCGTAVTNQTSFATTSIPAGTFLIAKTSSTAGTPTRDELWLNGFKP
jgi:hypothetical protein